jgi:hypothetical protein
MIASYKFWDKFKFASSLNFKGIQTFLKKSDKFSKIPCSNDISEYKFILTYFKLFPKYLATLGYCTLQIHH